MFIIENKNGGNVTGTIGLQTEFYPGKYPVLWLAR
jgi:hypothetical protein